jgi:hypothetical protein
VAISGDLLRPARSRRSSAVARRPGNLTGRSNRGGECQRAREARTVSRIAFARPTSRCAPASALPRLPLPPPPYLAVARWRPRRRRTSHHYLCLAESLTGSSSQLLPPVASLPLPSKPRVAVRVGRAKFPAVLGDRVGRPAHVRPRLCPVQLAAAACRRRPRCFNVVLDSCHWAARSDAS